VQPHAKYHHVSIIKTAYYLSAKAGVPVLAVVAQREHQSAEENSKYRHTTSTHLEAAENSKHRHTTSTLKQQRTASTGTQQAP
jgi:hypothetical protein